MTLADHHLTQVLIFLIFVMDSEAISPHNLSFFDMRILYSSLLHKKPLLRGRRLFIKLNQTNHVYYSPPPLHLFKDVL